MRLYIEVALRSFRRATTYRTAYLAGTLTHIFFAALICYVYRAAYAGGGSVAGFSLGDAISYSWTTQALISIGAGWIVMHEVGASIRSGDVISDLQRPWSFFLYWLSRSLGDRLFNLIVRGGLTYLIGALYFGARLPAPADLPAFAVSLVLALLVSFAIGFCVNLTAFWLLDSTGVTLLVNVLQSFFSGFILPIAFFPPALAALAYALPFQAVAGLPAQIFLGQLRGPDLAWALLGQLAWAAALIGLALAMQAAAMRKVVVQGG